MVGEGLHGSWVVSQSVEMPSHFVDCVGGSVMPGSQDLGPHDFDLQM